MITSMMLRIAGLAVPGPGGTIGAVKAVAGRIGEVVEAAVGLPERVGRLLTDTERLIARTAAIAEQAAAVVARTEATVTVAEQAVATARSAAELADSLLSRYAPLAERAEPLARLFVEELSEQEVRGAIRLVDLLPELAVYMERDVLPILATMDRVGPDLHELLEVSKDVRHAIHGIPGFRFFERRGASLAAEESDQTQPRRP
jgi:hypothetical protein